MNQYDKDKAFMKEVYEYAISNSDDPDTKSGCIVLTKNNEKLHGANRIPGYIEAKDWMVEKPLKYEYIEHCERDLIAKSAHFGCCLYESEMYINFKSCMPCARAIINAGIKRVVIHKEGQETYEKLAKENKGGDWHEIDSIEFMRSAGIQVDYLSMDFGGEVKARFRGVDVTL